MMSNSLRGGHTYTCITMRTWCISSPISVRHHSIRFLSAVFSKTKREGSVENMLCGEACVTDVNTAVRVKLLPQFNPLVESDTSRFDPLAAALSLSFQNEPRIKYMVPDEQ